MPRGLLCCNGMCLRLFASPQGKYAPTSANMGAVVQVLVKECERKTPEYVRQAVLALGIVLEASDQVCFLAPLSRLNYTCNIRMFTGANAHMITTQNSHPLVTPAHFLA